ncbi:MAG: hypothetical protein ACR2OZ_20785 [Verrucomicrobiales bacterium]
MKLEHLFLGVCLLLLAVTALLAVHYRTELAIEKERSRLATGPSAVPQSVAKLSPANSAGPANAIDSASLKADADKHRLIEQLKISEQEKGVLSSKAKEIQNSLTTVAPANAPLTEQQIKIKEAPAIAKVKTYKADHGIAVLDHGTDRGLKTDQVYAVRRGHYVVARKLIIGETVEANECAAIVDAGTLQPGEVLRPGDEVIKWE